MQAIINDIKKKLRMGMYDYFYLEGPDTLRMNESGDYDTFVDRQGGMVSFIEIRGGITSIGSKHFWKTINSLNHNLRGTLNNDGYRLQFTFTNDPSLSHRDIDKSMDLVDKTFDDVNLSSLKAITKERRKHLAKLTNLERCYLVVTTLKTSLMGKEASKALSKRADKAKAGLKPCSYGQSPFLAIDKLRDKHIAFVNSVLNELEIDYVCRWLDCNESLLAIKTEIDPHNTPDEWTPIMLRPKRDGDDKLRLKPRLNKDTASNQDFSHIMAPDLSFQMFSKRPKLCENDQTMISYGKQIIAPLMVDIPQETTTDFGKLFNKIPRNIPWRYSITIESGHKRICNKISTKKQYASFMSLFNSENKDIRDSIQDLLTVSKSETLMRCNMNISTWGKDFDEVETQKESLSQIMQNWGSQTVINEYGDPFQLWMNNLPGVSDEFISTPYISPLSDVLSTTPITRTSSPWDKGSLLFRTMDGKLYPRLPVSALQANDSTLIVAPPGMGKSFLAAAMNTAIISKFGNKVLPRITIIDIGYSGENFTNMIKDALPEGEKHLAGSLKLENTVKHAINILDLPLGNRFPLSVDREKAVNFLTELLTPAGTKEPIMRLDEVISMLIDEAYIYFSDDKNPKGYNEFVDEVVDAAIAKTNINMDVDVTWFNVVDRLFKAGAIEGAIRAMRHAVPTIPNLSKVLTQSENIQSTFSTSIHKGVPILEFIKTSLVTAANTFPMLNAPSAIDLGSMRIAAIDIQNIAQKGSALATKKTAIAYMLARQMGAREFYRSDEDIDEFNPMYYDYHKAIIDADSTVPKVLVMDEFHRTGNGDGTQSGVREQATTDIREGRKYEVQVVLISQSIDDFDSKMVEFATNKIVLGTGSAKTRDKIANLFELKEDSIEALRMLRGPTGKGSSMLYISEVKGAGQIEVPLYLSLGPTECWAYSTTPKDVHIRRRLTKAVGLDNALKILAQEYPSGSAAKYIEARRSEIDDDIDGNDPESPLFETIKNELVSKYSRQIT
ncbi:hypothetical protein AB6D11_02745 [Vibrio splendidus]